jgi:hypothetical protein
MKRAIRIVIVLTLLTATAAFTGTTTQPATAPHEPRTYPMVPWGVSFGMDGTVKNVVSADGHIKFQITGRVLMNQYLPDQPRPVVIEVHPEQEFSATITQADPFFAMTKDWGGGSIRKGGDLLKILKSAAVRGNVVRFDLEQPEMDFGPNQQFTLVRAIVRRATDADLK